MPTYRPSKVELADTVELMQKRLESLLRQWETQPLSILTPPVQTSSLGSSADSAVPPKVESIPNGLFRQHHGSDFSADLPSDFFSNSYSARSSIGNGAMAVHTQGEDFFRTPQTACSPIDHGSLPFQPQGGDFSADLSNDFFNSSRAGRTRSGTDISSVQALETLGSAGGRTQEDHHGLWMPSLRELRGVTAASLSQGTTEADNKNSSGIAATACLAELSAFSTAIFTTQAEVAGVSLAVAEYLAWMRKEPQPPANLTRMLQTLEARAREVHEMARTRHWTAWRAMAAALEPHESLGPSLRGLEEDLLRREAEVDNFFEVGYSAGQALTNQYKP
ncbi:hypothetical protein J7T55_011001 [Diaporthe amygdali]|uniref:uncharacterized protein n=1 Tax=Phomopsis amygdali TaxID=1214568 RepID=UPI0022FDE2F7|nr:uncharacterized protein J7T55_011001 [Diaporthe amygdali]KAJ0103984.1 hypothetical protein J7T55_011001 [Diaporthe amygdali]